MGFLVFLTTFTVIFRMDSISSKTMTSKGVIFFYAKKAEGTTIDPSKIHRAFEMRF